MFEVIFENRLLFEKIIWVL